VRGAASLAPNGALAALCLTLLGACGGTDGAPRDPALGSQAPRRAATATQGGERPPESAEPAPTAASSGDPPSVAPPVGGGWWDAYAERPALESFEGRASYYADSLAGRSTASGQPYDPTARTAASRTLPFGTVLRVIRPDTGASVIVRVNDRGPFGDRRRVLDLSRAAAEALDMIRRGVADVRVEVLERPAR
jgi:rare lipoprotein A